MPTPNDVMPRTYDQWLHCITVTCGIPLTAAYIDSRLSALKNAEDETTQRFIRTYGSSHHAAVVGWFERARQRLID